MYAVWILAHQNTQILIWAHVCRPPSGAVFSYKLRYIVGISTNQKPTIYRNLYENTGPAHHTERLYKHVTQRHSTTEQFQKVLFDFHLIISWHFMINLVLSVWNAKPCHFTFLIKRNALYSAQHKAYHIKGDEFIANNTMANKSTELAFLSVNQ